MKYMMLIYTDPANDPSYGTPEFESMMSGYFAANEQMKNDGVLCGGRP